MWIGDLDHFEAFCKTLTLDNGRRFELEPFQRTILADYFRGAKETLVIIPKKSGKCVDASTLLSLADGGTRRAADLAPGDEIVGWDGAPRRMRVTAVEKQPAKPCVDLTTHRGRALRCTADHPVLVDGRSGTYPSTHVPRPAWVAAGDLSPGDRVVIGLGHAPASRLDEISSLDAWVLGVLVGDGGLSGPSTPRLTAADLGVRRRVEQRFALRHITGYDYRVLGATGFCREHGIAGTSSHTKRLPAAVAGGSAAVIAAFLAGYLDTDGSVSNPAVARKPNVTWWSVNRELLVDCQHALAALGINATLSLKNGTYKGERHVSWRLGVADAGQVAALARLLDVTVAHKRAALDGWARRVDAGLVRCSGTLRTDRVAHVRRVGDRATVGIEVDGAHTHVTGGIVTHNTTLLAALLVYHLAYVDNARAYLAASSIKQAGECYGFSQGFVNRSAALQRRILVRAGTRELRSKRDDGFALVLADDAKTADGVGPTLFIIDELHRAASTAMYDIARDGLDARDGAMLAITTAGADEDGPLGVMRSNYLAMPGKRVRGRYTYCRSRDKTNVMHEWALLATDDLEDIELVKSVNPRRGMTLSKLRRRRDSPSMTMAAWARFACNIWTQGDDAAISTIDWARRGRGGLRLPDGTGARKVLGIDAGWTKDTFAMVPVGYPAPPRDVGGELELPDEAWIDERLLILPAGTQPGPPIPVNLPDDLPDDLARLACIGPGRIEDGRMTDEEVVKGALVRYWLLWPDLEFAIDPNAGGQSLAQWIVRELCGGDDERVITHSQQPAPMQLASMHFSAGIRTRSVQEPADDPVDDEDENRTVPLWHPDHEGLNRHVRAAAASWSGDRWRFDKRTKPRTGSTKVNPQPIDAVIAVTLGYRGLMQTPEEGLEPFVM